MAIITAWKYDADGDGTFTGVLGTTDRLVFSNNDTALESISVDAWNPNSLAMTNDLVTVNGTAKNCRYISTTEIALNTASSVTLNPTNVVQDDCTLKIEWEDDAVDTALSSCVFYVYNGTDPTIAPSGVVFCAFERTASAIRIDTIGTVGAAWDSAVGIGGNASALDLEQHSSAADHVFFIGLSAKPTAFGLNTNIRMRVEFDVS